MTARRTALLTILCVLLAAGCAKSDDPWGDGYGDGGPDTSGDTGDAVWDGGDGAWEVVPDGPLPDGTDMLDEDAPCAEETFEVTETQEVFIVPDHAVYMYVKAWGAGANGELGCDYDNGGLGGFSAAVFEVTPGDPLIIIVGRRGRAGLAGEDIIRFGFGHWGGGGLSGVFRGPDLIDENSQDDALIIAGGGGGASAPGCQPGGPGNHPDAGGMTTMMGGPGGDDVNGGGGGYEGGTGGARGVGGLGGTGHVDSSALDHVMLHGEVGETLPPRSDDPDYDGVAGTNENSGLVYVHFICDIPPII